MGGKNVLLQRLTQQTTTKTSCCSPPGCPAGNDQKVCGFTPASILVFILPSVFKLLTGDSPENPPSTRKPSQSWHKPLPSDRHNNILRHWHTHTRTYRLQAVCFRKVALPPSVVRFGDALLHNLPEVWVLHGSRHSLLIVDLFVNWRHKLHWAAELQTDNANAAAPHDCFFID